MHLFIIRTGVESWIDTNFVSAGSAASHFLTSHVRLLSSVVTESILLKLEYYSGRYGKTDLYLDQQFSVDNFQFYNHLNSSPNNQVQLDFINIHGLKSNYNSVHFLICGILRISGISSIGLTSFSTSSNWVKR